MPPALLAAKDLSPDGELFRGATLSLCSHAPHIAQSLSSDCGHWSGPVGANAEGGQDPFTVCSGMRHAEDLHPVQKTSASLYPDWLLSLPAHRIHAREQDRLHAGASLHPRELSRASERDGSYSLAEKRHANSGMRSLGPMPAFQTAQDEGRTCERIPSSSISTRKPTCNELAPCLVCARVLHK